MAAELAQSTGPHKPSYPAHVPKHLIVDFDIFYDKALIADPHARILDLHKTAPRIFWSPYNGGHWVVMGYNDNYDLARDTESFTSNISYTPERAALVAQMMPQDMPHIPTMAPISMDPPRHAAYRQPLNSAFSPRRVTGMRDEIQALARQLLLAVRHQGGCEFMGAIAEPLPIEIFLKLMGLPIERMAEFRQIAVETMRGAGDPPELTIGRLLRLTASMRETLLARQKEPRDDVISHLWQMKIDGQATSMDDIENYASLLFVAGLDTVILAMGFAARHLAMNPGLQDQLRANPSLITEASEEMLRRYAFTSPNRRANKDVTFRGIEMKHYDLVVQYLPAANIDPEYFPEADQFKLDRENKVHLVFNAGPHRCMGSHLARIELQAMFEEMLTILPPFRLDSDKPPVFHGGYTLGLDELHLRWDY